MRTGTEDMTINFISSCQLANKNPKPLELFCEQLKQEGIPYSVSGCHARHLPKIKLPK